MSALFTPHGHNIYALDAHLVRPRMTSIHFIIEKNRLAIVDAGHNGAIPHVLNAFKALGLSLTQVDYVLLTHVHLDHAGGAGSLMALCPNATLLVHPRGVRHMINPAKLMEAVKEVYGVEETQRLYGELVPILESRIRLAADGLSLDFSGRKLTILDTPGHAAHHVSIVDERTGHIFPGDVFGISYRELDHQGRAFVFPTTSPSQFDPEALHHSVRRISERAPEAVYLTHFSKLTDISRQAERLHARIDALVDIAKKWKNDERRKEKIEQDVGQFFLKEIRAQGSSLTDEEILKILETDMDLNAQGLDHWLGTCP